MSNPKLTLLLETFREIYLQYDIAIKDFKTKYSVITAGLPCNFIPPEILSASGIIPLIIPSYLFRDSCINEDAVENVIDGGIYDILIFPEKCRKKPEKKIDPPVYYFEVPEGYGRESLNDWRKNINNLLMEINGKSFLTADREILKSAVEDYDGLRRIVRGILNLRKSNPSDLYFFDIKELIEYALVFPPQMVRESLVEIFEEMRETKTVGDKKMVNSLIYSSIINDRLIFDRIEDLGCLIFEDDLCLGGRQFDTSLDLSTPELYGEILECFSFKPLCPCIRPAAERFDLMFSMVKKFGIDLVIFIEDLCCKKKKEDIDFLKRRLMRNCVDTIVSDSGNILMEIKKYLERL